MKMKRADAVESLRLVRHRGQRATSELYAAIARAIESGEISARMPLRHYPFYRAQGWYFNFAWPQQMIAADVGNFLVFTSPEKWNFASSSGWRVFRFSPKEVRDGRAIGVLARALAHPPLFKK
jgi:hypothetical protein